MSPPLELLDKLFRCVILDNGGDHVKVPPWNGTVHAHVGEFSGLEVVVAVGLTEGRELRMVVSPEDSLLRPPAASAAVANGQDVATVSWYGPACLSPIVPVGTAFRGRM